MEGCCISTKVVYKTKLNDVSEVALYLTYINNECIGRIKKCRLKRKRLQTAF
ncbi:hypothetical protein NEILACOT_03086 [Neisseria lactamica ATCC 23970]|uniref:Uncharacterized protein n=1 Tax=Neisseria lactamica ATCC 23970 TaxID=546265 RepID=D0W6E8_NEILA|nr:hypothetical protein NEILACOT_03086 [Neisseria lactamica ATCC 23970]